MLLQLITCIHHSSIHRGTTMASIVYYTTPILYDAALNADEANLHGANKLRLRKEFDLAHINVAVRAWPMSAVA